MHRLNRQASRVSGYHASAEGPLAALMMIALIAVPCIARATGAPTHAHMGSLGVPMATADFEGVWSTTFGELAIKQTGMMASGEYTMDGGKATISGMVSGQRFTFTYQESRASGEGWLEMVEGGKSFTGQWKASNSTTCAEWNGTRGTGQAPPAVSPPAARTSGADADAVVGNQGASQGFSVLWRTAFGPMRLTVQGAACNGVYLYNGLTCTITGTQSDGVLTFRYDQPDGEKGGGAFTLAPGGEAFDGTWQSASGAKGTWDGRRQRARAGVTNLVVLEAHWERALGDRAYSFGEMLRTFFQRVPAVAFHHRFVHDESDVRRFAAEATFLAEPVVLYFSSHGSAAGLSMGGKTVPPESIAGALRGATNIRLLHFGACEVMAGDAAQRIASAVGGAFPISGYANTADWGGSAVVDITYLMLILEHGQDPAAAITQTRASIAFASTDGAKGPIAPSALRILVPGQGMK